MMSDPRAGGRVLKASAARLRRVDPHTVPTDQRIAEAESVAFRAGYEQGFQAGALEAGSELAVAVDRLQRSVVDAVQRQLAEARATRAADAERLVELALAVAEWAVRRELAAVPEAFFGRLEELLAERDRHQQVEIFTAAALVEPTRRWLAEADGLGGAAVRVSPAEDLEPGEARVLLDDTTVFATFTDAFERARELLDDLDGAGARGRNPHEGDASDDEAPGADGADHDDEVVEVLYDASAALDGVA